MSTIQFQIGLDDASSDQLTLTFGGFGLTAITGSANSIAGSGVDAEICATALLLAGEGPARAEADRLGVACVLVTCDERAVMAGGLA